jgi:hypothetical protein
VEGFLIKGIRPLEHAVETDRSCAAILLKIRFELIFFSMVFLNKTATAIKKMGRYTVAKAKQFSIHGWKGEPQSVNFVDVG